MRLAFWQQRPWLTATVAFLVAAVVGFAFAFPAAIAAACPQCFGFERIERRVYVQRGMTPDEKTMAADVIKKARERIRGFYGEQRGNAIILICATDPCYRRLRGGGSRGMAIYDRVLMLSPEGLNETIAAHELSHIEFHRRVGAWKIYREAVPTWFDEGLAVVVSQDPRYLPPPDRADACRTTGEESLPETLREWLRDGEKENLYSKAACRVSTWITANGGLAAVLRLAQNVANGVPFDEAYHEPRRATP